MRSAIFAIAFCAAALVLLAPAAAAGNRTVLYNNSTGTLTYGNWTDGHANVTIENLSNYVSRIGPFVIGENPSDSGAGPIITGLMVGMFALAVLGRSRSGFIASGTMAVVVFAALSLQAALLPRWVYGTAIMLMAFIAGVIYIRVVR